MDRETGRRDVLGATLALVALPVGAAPAGDDVAAAQRELIGGAAVVETGITLRMPATAEHGGQVPLVVTVDSPQGAGLHVAAIHVLATRNPTPGVASFRLGGAIARAEVQTRIRLAEHQQVIALALMSDGTARRAVAEVRVSQGGCLT